MIVQSAAQSAIAAANLSVGAITAASSATVAAGNVLSQNPAAGAGVPSGTAVALVVSAGPTVPNVLNLTQSAATTAITNAGLTIGSITTTSHVSVPAGSVISQNPAAGTGAALGTPVNLAVSTGSAPNVPPTITSLADQTINEDTATGALSFTVGDGESAAGSLVVSGSSSNPTLVPNANLVFGGSGANRTVVVTPAANQFGTATIMVTVSDGQYGVSTNFLLTVSVINDGPTISSIANQALNVGGSTGPLSFTVGDVETAAGSLTVGGSSSNPTLVPNANLVFGGSGANRTVTVTPVAGQSGTATLTVVVSDGVLSASNSFGLTVSSLLTGTRSFTNAAAITIPDAGSSYTASGSVTLTLSDAAAALLPASSAISSGTFKPTDYASADTFSAPAPAGPYATTLATFNGQAANGAWALYVYDDGPGDLGSVAGGWSLTITTFGTSSARLAAVAEPLRITAVTVNNQGAVRVTISGVVGRSYALEASGDFLNWTKVDVQDNVTGSIVFTEQPTNSIRFYRAVSLPK